jgi:hypothetical protein
MDANADPSSETAAAATTAVSPPIFTLDCRIRRTGNACLSEYHIVLPLPQSVSMKDLELDVQQRGLTLRAPNDNAFEVQVPFEQDVHQAGAIAKFSKKKWQLTVVVPLRD